MKQIKQIRLGKRIAFTMLLLFCQLWYSPTVYGQQNTITINETGVSIKDLLTRIEKETNYTFIYNASQVNVNQKIDLNVQNETVRAVLGKIFTAQDIKFEIDGTKVVLSAVTRTGAQTTVVNKATTTVTGKVSEKETGQTAIGVAVVVKGTNIGTVTDLDGSYSLANVPTDGVLVFSSIGKGEQSIEVNNRSEINLVIADDATRLNEVVVVGYGSSTVKDLTAPISVIKSAELSKQTVSNAAQALQGKVSGVLVSSSGKPGSSPNIKIRGLGTVESNASPLYVVDDMFVSDISFLSSNDIESMTILKDASSSAIYGVRAANGVILITTKKGSKIEQKPVVNYNGYVGVQTLVQKFKMANASEYKTLTHEKLKVTGATPIDFEPYTGNTDWLDEIFNSALMHNHEVSVSGNTGKTNYFVGVNHLSQDGIIINTNYKRSNIRAAHDINLNKYVKLGYNINISYFDETNPYHNGLGAAYYTPPIFTVKNSDGTFTNVNDGGITDVANAAAAFEYHKFDKTRGTKFLPNAYFEIKPIDDLKFRSSFTADGGNSKQKVFVPEYSVSGKQKNDISTFEKTDAMYLHYNFDNTLTYSKTINKHRFSVMAGGSMIHFSNNYTESKIKDVPFVDESSLYLKNGDQKTLTASDDGSKIRSLSYFGRVFYSFDNKYLFTGTLRRDGSSTFPKANRWATAPSIGLGWVVSEEGFLKDKTPINFLKLRTSWGVLGNNNVPQNAYTTNADTNGKYSMVFGPFGSSNVSQGATITSITEPALKWETVEEIDLGFEIKMFKNRFNLEFDYYYRKTKDAIFPYPILGVIGTATSSVLRNNADILNKGVEINMGWTEKLSEKFSFNVGFNIASNHNEVHRLSLGTIPHYSGSGINGTQAAYTRLGGPVGGFNVLQTVGIFQTQSEIDNYVNSQGIKIQADALPGDFKYEDKNDDGVLSEDDKVMVGSYMPKVIYGFSLGFVASNVDFSVDFQGVSGNKIYNFKRVQRFGNENYDKDFYKNRWHGANTSDIYPSADISGRKNSLPNTFWVESGSYLRIKNVQLGYTFPSEQLTKVGISSLRLYLSAQNPFTFFKYKGMTPEITGSNSVKITELQHKSTEQGFDNQIYPLSTVLTFGVNLKF